MMLIARRGQEQELMGTVLPKHFRKIWLCLPTPRETGTILTTKETSTCLTAFHSRLWRQCLPLKGLKEATTTTNPQMHGTFKKLWIDFYGMANSFCCLGKRVVHKNELGAIRYELYVLCN
mmetsp:Transcript_16184/g.29458  ORF Transcript_16184/g.29458 Transcript_16184/m.29458 type:complete len:120 (+) Transcript_16184:165-524(+)